MENKITLLKPDFEGMLICSVRYALTRKTYVTLLNIGYIKQYWDELSDNAKKVITEDIKEGVELYNSEEFKIDNNSWRECLSWILSLIKVDLLAEKKPLKLPKRTIKLNLILAITQNFYFLKCFING